MSRSEIFGGKRKMEKNMDAITIKLKKMLLSRNVVLQDQCIQFMIRSLKDPKQFDLISTTFLNADMVQYLCEPLLSINTSLIQSICLCVWMLSKNKTFYERNDVLYTCNSVMRTLVFLIRTRDTSVSDLIQLLAILIKKGGTNLQEICNMPQILTIIKMIFTNSQDLPSCCVINAISILSYFLSCPSVELSNKLYSTSMSISEAICKSVKGKCIIDSYVVDISSNLSSSLLRLYSTITSRVLLNEHLQKHKETAKLLKNIAWYMIKHIILPFVLKHINISMYYKSCRKGIKSLLSPFRENLPRFILQNIANHYAASRTIRILYESIEYKQIGILAEELLFEMMFHLSSAYLEIDSHWPGGSDMFRNQLIWSFKNFPRTPKDICSILRNSKNTDMKHSIIIFIYFYLLTCSNIENESIYLEPICVYLGSIQNEIPTPVIKAVLLNISITFVSHNAVNAVTGLTFATKKLVALINTQMFDLIFTYHPAIMYFLFATSLIPEKIKLQLIKQWIVNLDDISFIELEKFCLKNDKAKLCLLNVLINDTTIDSNKLHIGFDVVKKIIAIEKDLNEHKTLLTIWENLPTNLGSFCCTEYPTVVGATNLMLLLNLTDSFSINGPNVCINEHRNIVYTMSSIIKSYQSTFAEQYSLLSSLLQHILTLIQLSNGDVLNTIKNHKEFLCVLQNLCLSENNKVCFLTYNTIIQLCQLEKEGTKKEHTILNSISIKCEYILNAMSRNCQNCKISSITLFQIIIQYYEKYIDNAVEFNEILTVEFFKSVFIQLKTIISQGLDWVSDHAWECITTLLKNLQNLPTLQYEFATDPWLYFLLTNFKFFNKKCLTFLHFWFTNFVLTIEESFTLCGVKTLCPSLFDKTIIHISLTIVNHTYKKRELLMEAKNIINLILKSKFLLPNGLERKIKNFLNVQE